VNINLATLASHTVDLDLLPERCIVLDVGCRNFDFSREILRVRPRARVIAMDPDPWMQDEHVPGVEFLRAGLDLVMGVRHYQHFSTGEANHLCDDPATPLVPVMAIRDVMTEYAVPYFDVVKFDCEGSEFSILPFWPGAHVATQLSVEFHDWDKPDKGDAYFAGLFSGALAEYDVVQHELSAVGPGPSWGHWDTLLTRKA
jgi:hypothetical protein